MTAPSPWFGAAISIAALCGAAACGGSTVFPGGVGGSGGSGTGGSSDGGGGGSPTGGGGSGGDPCDCGANAYIPVCGVDGVTYDGACGDMCIPVDVACDGECPCENPRCDELEEAYAISLRKAKSCRPQLPVEQCEGTTSSNLACPCPTTIDSSNNDAIMELAQLQSEWDNLGCSDQVVCTDEECPMPDGGACTPNGNSGTCEDVFTNP